MKKRYFSSGLSDVRTHFLPSDNIDTSRSDWVCTDQYLYTPDDMGIEGTRMELLCVLADIFESVGVTVASTNSLKRPQ